MIQTDKPSLSVCAFSAGAVHAAALALILPIAIALPAPKDEARGTVAIQVAVRTARSTQFIQATAAHAASGMPHAALEGEGDADEASWAVLEAEDVTGALPEMPQQAVEAELAKLMEQAALSAPVEDATGALLEQPEMPEQTAAEPAPLVEQAALPASAEDVTGAPTEMRELPEQAAAAEPAPLVEQAALPTPVEAATPVEAPRSADVPEATLVEDAPAPVIEEEMTLATVATTETALSEEPAFMPDVVPRPLRKPEALPVVVEETVQKLRPAPRQRVTSRAAQPQPAAKPFKGLLGGTRATPMAEFPFGAGR